MAASVAPEGYKRERDGDGDSDGHDGSGLPKKLRSEDTASLIGGAGRDNDGTLSEPKDEDMNGGRGGGGGGGGGDGTKIGSVEEGGEEEVERGNSSHDEGDALVSEEKKKEVLEAKVGPKVFTSSLDMLNYFHEFVRTWPLNYNVNKFEFLMLEDLIKQGHQDPENKIGVGIEAFQVRMNPMYASRCYYIIRKDGSTDDFSYRKCVDNIFPLPEELKAQIGDKLGVTHQGAAGGQNHNNNNSNSKNYYRGRGGRHGGGRGGYGRGHRGGKRF